MRLIDADELKEEIRKIVKEESPIHETWAAGLRYSLKIIDNTPTVKEVSVIEFKEPVPLVTAQKIVKFLSDKQSDIME